MFFVVAKTLGVMAQTPNLLIETLLVGVALNWTRWLRAGRIVSTVAAAAIGLFAFTPIANLLARPLEDRFPQPHLTDAPTGIVVLGGAMDEAISQQRGQSSLNEAVERMTEAVALTRRFPEARLVFSGGSGRLHAAGTTEADVARALWLSLGVPADSMTFESRSRDTYENAVFTKALIQPKPGERWLLVTSAMHMPRSVGIFRKIDFSVIPYPVDYQTGGVPADFYGVRQAAHSFYVLEAASHEWIGLATYYLTGKSAALFPAP